MSKAIYRLRFFFDFNCGGCLWCDNDAAYQKFDGGILDADIYDLDGRIMQEAKIKLPPIIKQKVLALDKLFADSLNENDPGGASLWNNNQWGNFHKQASALHKEISLALGDDFEVVYMQS